MGRCAGAHLLRDRARHLPVPPHMSQETTPVPRHSLHRGISPLGDAAPMPAAGWRDTLSVMATCPACCPCTQ